MPAVSEEAKRKTLADALREIMEYTKPKKRGNLPICRTIHDIAIEALKEAQESISSQ